MTVPTIGKINDREIFYIDTINNPGWETVLPESNWSLFAIADDKQISQLDHLAKICLDKNVLYICGAGKASSRIDDAFDIEIVDRKIEANDDNYDNTPMTTWHNDFDEGFWFASTVAYHDIILINKLVCINLTDETYRERIVDLINKINNGWLPED